MIPNSRLAHAYQDQPPSDLLQLTAAVEALPAAERLAIRPLLDRVLDSTLRRRRILHLVQEAIGQLRLDMKYLMFDLEATRRERDAYRHKLEEGTP